jgi:hypothetical protein
LACFAVSAAVAAAAQLVYGVGDGGFFSVHFLVRFSASAFCRLIPVLGSGFKTRSGSAFYAHNYLSIQHFKGIVIKIRN